jgi:hypothetical protein
MRQSAVLDLSRLFFGEFEPWEWWWLFLVFWNVGSLSFFSMVSRKSASRIRVKQPSSLSLSLSLNFFANYETCLMRPVNWTILRVAGFARFHKTLASSCSRGDHHHLLPVTKPIPLLSGEQQVFFCVFLYVYECWRFQIILFCFIFFTKGCFVLLGCAKSLSTWTLAIHHPFCKKDGTESPNPRNSLFIS